MNTPRQGAFTILVIDDEESVRDLIDEVLRTSGHRILLASSGDAALEMVQASHPDLILVDYALPGMTGLEVVQRLKASADTRRIPIVALTSATAHVANELSRAGCIAFIPKPFEPAAFRQLIAEILNETVGRPRSGA